MTLVLPRSRSFHRVKPMRLWWIAVAIAVCANLALVVGLSQISRLGHATVQPPLSVRSLRQHVPEPLPTVTPTEPQPPLAEVIPQIALPSLDLPSAGPAQALSLPALMPPALDRDLPLVIPAYAAAGTSSPDAPIAGMATDLAEVDSPAEREGSFDLDRFFPRSAKQRGITGSSRIRCTIDASGRVIAVAIVESTPAGIFEQAAERLAYDLHFRPAMKAGRPVVSQQDAVIAWTLK